MVLTTPIMIFFSQSKFSIMFKSSLFEKIKPSISKVYHALGMRSTCYFSTDRSLLYCMFTELLWLLSCVSYLLALKKGKRELFFSGECITEFLSGQLIQSARWLSCGEMVQCVLVRSAGPGLGNKLLLRSIFA